MRAFAQHLVEMRGDDCARIDRQKPFGNRRVAAGGVDPQGGAAKAGIGGCFAFQPARHARFAGVDRKDTVGAHGRAGDFHPAQQDAVFAGGQFEAVAHAELRHDKAAGLAQLLAHPGDPRNQRRAAFGIDQMDQAIAELDRDQRMVGHIVEHDSRRVGRRGRRFGAGEPCAGGALLQVPPDPPGNRRGGQEHHLRHRRDHPDRAQNDHDRQPRRRIGELPADLPGEVAAVGNAGDDDRGGNRQQQRGDLRDQRVAHCQSHIFLRRIGRGQPVAEHAEAEPRDDIDPEDQHGGNRIAFDELARAIHRAVEIGFGSDFAAARLGFGGVDQPGSQIGVDCHLFAGQSIEREPRRDFGHAAGAFGHDHHVDDHQDHEHEQPDREIAADQKRAKALDHPPRRRPAGVAVDQHDAGRCDIERETQQRGEQQHRGK